MMKKAHLRILWMIELHPGQSDVYSDLFINATHRNLAVCCCRGWGKSYMAATAAITAVFELFELNEHVPNKNVYIIAPTYDQVTDIYYPLIHYDLGLGNYCDRSSRDLGRWWLPNNVELRLLSYEAIERMRGKGAYFVVWDEISSCKKGLDPREAWEGIIQPCIVTRWSPKKARLYGSKHPGRFLGISTPKGYNFFYDLCNYYEKDSVWGFYHFDYTRSPLTELDEIERIRHSIDPIQFASEYEAKFKESGNNVFYMFDRKLHVTKDLESFNKDEDVHVNIDFNVGLQCSSFFALRGKQIHILDEMQGHPDTESLAIAIKARYPGKKIHAYPDPTGKSRKTSAPVGQTDFTILQNAGILVHSRDHSPKIVDSVSAVNAKLKTAAGDIGLYIHPKCDGVIKSLERTRWLDNNQDSATIDKSEGVEHYSDGIRYGVEYLFPIRRGGKVVQRGHNF